MKELLKYRKVLLANAKAMLKLSNENIDKFRLQQIFNLIEIIDRTIESNSDEDLDHIKDSYDRIKGIDADKMGDSVLSFHSFDMYAEYHSRKLQNLYLSRERGIHGLDTGLVALDDITYGLPKAHLILVAGRPSMGKTSLVANFVQHAGIDLKLPVAVFSLEVGGCEFVNRMICSMTNSSNRKFQDAAMEGDDWCNYASKLGNAKNAPIFVDDSQGLTVDEIRSRSIKLEKNVGPLSLIIVDNLQLIKSSPRNGLSDKRFGDFAEISHGLKLLAREMNVPVVVTSQVNRAVEARPNHRPQLWDLSESGAIENDADMVLCLYRDEIYNKTTRDKNVAEIAVAKNRNGPTGIARLRFEGQFFRFSNLSEDGELIPSDVLGLVD